jgi:hypothetical protein
VKGRLLLSKPQLSAGEAELSFIQSLEMSQRQGTRAWKLRTVTALAALFASQGQSERGRPLLQTRPDLKAAERVLATLGSKVGLPSGTGDYVLNGR